MNAMSDAGTEPRGRYTATVDGIDAAEWERVVFSFDDAAYDQTHAYGAHLWGDGRLSHVVLRRDGDVVGAAQVVLLRPPLVARGIAYVKFGPLWRRKERPVDPAVLAGMLVVLKTEYAEHRGLLLTVFPPPDRENREHWQACLDEAGFRRRRRMTDPNRYLVNVSVGRDVQYRSLQQKWRYNLNKALAHDVRIQRADSAAALEDFNALYRRMVARKRFRDGSSVTVLHDLLTKLPPAMHPRIYVGALHGRPTVGAVVGLLGGTAYYLFGASDDGALAAKSGYALQWWIVGDLDGAARWYDLGGERGEQGLRQFKKGLVGKCGVVEPMLGEFDFWTSGLARLAGDAIFVVRSAREAARELAHRRLARRHDTNAGVH
jgi:hypothetical protein